MNNSHLVNGLRHMAEDHPCCEPTIIHAIDNLQQLERENADLRNTLDAVIWADERGVELWRAAHPGKELVIPDRAKLVEWLLEQNAAFRKDKERLDWIFWPSRSRKARTRMLKLIGTPGYRGDEGGMLAWRDAIDAAMKEGQQ